MEFEWCSPRDLHGQLPPGHTLLRRSSSHAQSSSSFPAGPLQPTLASSPSAQDAATGSLALIPSVPVPLITVGKVFAPITAGSRTVSPEVLEAARHLGLTHMLTAAMGSWLDPDEYWNIAALTDPLSAANLLQGVTAGQRRVIFTERGAAEKLARQKAKVVPTGRQHDWGGWLRALNPMTALENVCTALQGGVSKENALEAAAAAVEARIDETEPEEIYKLKTSGGIWPFKRKENNNNGSSSSGRSKSGLFNNNTRNDINKNTSGNEESGSNSRAALALLNVRLALSLLRGASGRFLLLSGRGKPGGGQWRNSETSSSEEEPQSFSGADSLDSLRVHFLPGVDLVLQTHVGTVKFTPAFLSAAALQSFWRQGIALYTAGMLRARRLQRREFCRRLQIAAALVAGAGVSGNSGGTGTAGGTGDSTSGSSTMFPGEDDDGEGEGFDEPPEIQEVIQEMMASGDLSGGMIPSSVSALEPAGNGLVRAGATFAVGLLALLGPSVEVLGEAIDKTVLLTGFGRAILGVPGDVPFESRSLGPTLRSMASYNATKAAEMPENAPSRDQTLGLAALTMGVATKMLGEDFILGPLYKSGPFGMIQAVEVVQKLMRDNADGSGSTMINFGSSGWAAATATAAMLTDRSGANMSKPGAVVAAVMRPMIHTLEYNGFPEAFPWKGSPDLAADALVKTVVTDDNRITAWVQISEPLTSYFPALSIQLNLLGTPQQHGLQQGVGAGTEGAEIARGLMVIGDPGLSRGISSPEGFTSRGGGMPVGVDDGRRYM